MFETWKAAFEAYKPPSSPSLLNNWLFFYVYFLSGLSLIFYFLSYWFCKPTIEEEEEKHRLEQLPNKEAAENDDNANGMGESSI